MKHRSALVTAAVLTATIIGGGTVMALNGGPLDRTTNSDAGTLLPTLAVDTVARPTSPNSVVLEADRIPGVPAPTTAPTTPDARDDHAHKDDDHKQDDHKQDDHKQNDKDHDVEKYEGHDDDD